MSSSSLSSLSHRLKPLESVQAGTLLVHELYRSLQGESTHAGLPCTFVRLTACNLRCLYCDTAHAFKQGRLLATDEVVSQVLAMGDQLVEITGGEPLLQEEVHPLMRRLCDAGRTVLLETGGSVSLAQVDPRVRVILDIKTPGSGESQANDWSNIAWLRPSDEAKFVICGPEDWAWTLATIQRHDLLTRCAVLASPCHGRVDPRDLAQWVLESRLPIRLQIQLHKLLWGAEARGV